MSVDALRAALADRYRIERELGAGGMATVYLAHDLKHDRDVAIKVLRPELAAVIGAERFLAEIKTTANLQHPHILSLFDSGAVDGTVFYVMPFVDGESLRDRLAREKPLPIADALRFATETADALQYAHQHGVIHRDIKPENILLHGGHALVADFGIALAASKTGGTRMTETGMSLGTPQYMSPEQAMGERDLDARTDVYALGCVTYEMLTGAPPFSGLTAQAIVARVVTEQPRSLTAQRHTIPPHVDSAVLTALQKLPADRFATAGAFAAALGDRSYPSATAAPAPLGTSRARLRDPLFLGVVAIALVAIATAAVLARGRLPQAVMPPITFQLATTDSTRPSDNSPWPGAISPDGGTLVYTVRPTTGAPSFYYLHTNELTPHLIPGTAGANQPYFSPDGQWLAFEMNGKERKVRLDGSAPVVISDGSGDNGAAWAPGNEIVLGSQGAFAGLSFVSAAGGTPMALTHVDSAHGERSHAWPIATPDGRAVIFAIWSGSLATAQLALTQLPGGKVTRLGVEGVRPLAVLDGMLVYVKSDGTVMAVGLDIAARKIRGSPIPVHDPVFVNAALNGNSEVYVSPGGAWLGATRSSIGKLSWFTPGGGATAISNTPGQYESLALSPDQDRIAVSLLEAGGQFAVGIYDLAQATLSRLSSAGSVISLAWSADGQRVFYVAATADGTALWVQPVSGGVAARQVVRMPLLAGGVTIDPDGRSAIITVIESGSWELRRISLDSGTMRTYLRESFNLHAARFSPDGKWIAMASDESGHDEVYLRSYPDPSSKVQISTGGGSEPAWSADGSRLYYVSGNALVSARLRTAPSMSLLGSDTVATAVPMASITGYFDPRYAPTRDGKRFVVAVPMRNEYNLIVSPNWITEFRRKVAESRAPQP